MNKTGTIIGIIVAIAIVGYGGYRLYHHFTYKPPAPVAVAHTQTMTAKPTSSMAMGMGQSANYIKMIAYKGFKKKVITDPKDMTLYIFTKDKHGVSNCNGACAKIWPPYLAKSQTGQLPANLTVIKRSDGTMQYAWKGMPLYYYVKDTKPGDTNGNGVKGVWFAAM